MFIPVPTLNLQLALRVQIIQQVLLGAAVPSRREAECKHVEAGVREVGLEEDGGRTARRCSAPSLPLRFQLTLRKSSVIRSTNRSCLALPCIMCLR